MQSFPLFRPTLFEEQALTLGYKAVFGLDEAGRGPLAGPVVAAACHIPFHVCIDGIDDSKKLDEEQRTDVYKRLINHPEVNFGVGILDAQAIDQMNILQASLQAMLIAVENATLQADYLLVDGLIFPKTSLPGLALAKGDGLSRSIGAASIIAKCIRDEIMVNYHKQYPEYGFDEHKGYATAKHLEAIHSIGASPIHRLSFEPIKSLFLNSANTYTQPMKR